MWLTSRRSDGAHPPARPLPGRPDYDFPLARTHEVLGTSMLEPFGPGVVRLYLAMGCFWGAEKRLWQLPGVYTTAVGYQGGVTPHPSYEEVCTGRTGHAETVMVAYDPRVVSTVDVLRVFWENHDPTQGMRQGNDVGTQYRSAAYWTTPEQGEVVMASKRAYQDALAEAGRGRITTELSPLAEAGDGVYYTAEPEHQQYLAKNPFGYRCHANTGVKFPATA